MLYTSIDQSTASLKSTSTTYDVLDSVMVTSKHLITALEKSDWLDRMLIFAALAFFILVVLFILKQRILDRGLRIAFFWTRFLPSSSSTKAARATVSVVKDALGDAMEQGSASPVMASVTVVTSSVLSAATIAAMSASASLSSSLASSSSEAAPSAVDPVTERPLESLAKSLGVGVSGQEPAPERTSDLEILVPVQSDVSSHDEL